MSYGNLKPYIIVYYIRSDILFKQLANVVIIENTNSHGWLNL